MSLRRREFCIANLIETWFNGWHLIERERAVRFRSKHRAVVVFVRGTPCLNFHIRERSNYVATSLGHVMFSRATPGTSPSLLYKAEAVCLSVCLFPKNQPRHRSSSDLLSGTSLFPRNVFSQFRVRVRLAAPLSRNRPL